MMTNKELAAAARERGEDRFTAVCKKHGEQSYYTANRRCTACAVEMNARMDARRQTDQDYRQRRNAGSRATWAKRMENPERRAESAAYHRGYHGERMATDPAYAAHRRALMVNLNARRRLRKLKRPETAMPSRETLGEILEAAKRTPAAAELDHAIPLKGIHPVTGEWVVSGLHVSWNLERMEARSNKRKTHSFDPENPLEFQKPYNSFPGGQFHGDIGEIEFMRYTTPTTLELWTVAEFHAAIVAAGNEDMPDGFGL